MCSFKPGFIFFLGGGGGVPPSYKFTHGKLGIEKYKRHEMLISDTHNSG